MRTCFPVALLLNYSSPPAFERRERNGGSMYKKALMAALLMAVPVTWAQPQAHDAPPPPNAQKMEQFEAAKASRIAQKLNLDPAATQKLKETLDSFAPRRKALHEQMVSNVETLRKAAQGDAGA